MQIRNILSLLKKKLFNKDKGESIKIEINLQFQGPEIVKYEELPNEIREVFESLKYEEDAAQEYELLAGGFAWTDEYSIRLIRICSKYNNYYYRFLLAYRASLILGREDHRFQDIWNNMKIRFPNWPGFRKERCDPALKEKLLLARENGVDDVIGAIENFTESKGED